MFFRMGSSIGVFSQQRKPRRTSVFFTTEKARVRKVGVVGTFEADSEGAEMSALSKRVLLVFRAACVLAVLLGAYASRHKQATREPPGVPIIIKRRLSYCSRSYPLSLTRAPPRAVISRELLRVETMEGSELFLRARRPKGHKLVDPSHHSPGGRVTRFVGPARAPGRTRRRRRAATRLAGEHIWRPPGLIPQRAFASREIRSSSEFLRFLDQVTHPK